MMFKDLHKNSDTNSNHLKETQFFLLFSAFLTFIVFGGFILNWVLNPGNFGRIAFWTGLHGAFSATWYLLLLNQIRLSGSESYAAHKLWGRLSVFLVMAILLTGLLMILEVYDRLAGFGVFNPDDAQARIRAGGFIGGTVLQWVIFTALYVLGILNVRRSAHHKRFMLAAAIQMMPEGINRLTHVLTLPGYSMFIFMILIYLILMAYDWKIYKRIHISTIFSFGLFVLLAVSIQTVFRSQVWGDWVVKILSSF